MALCLTLVCLFCGGVLGVVYAVTCGPIEDAARKELRESIGMVLPEGGEISDVQSAEAEGAGYEYYRSAGSDGNVLAYAVKSTVNGFGGPLTLMVGVLPDGTVHATRVLSHSETPGLGAKCVEEDFASQFRGFGPSKVLKVRKDGGEVDAITASTITSRAYTLAVSNAVNLVRTLEGGNAPSDAWSGASLNGVQNENKEELK